MKYWFVATYKINELNRLERNLLNQNLEYYLPKITIKKINTKTKNEVLFPGYIFIKTELDKYSSIKFTKGIRNIIRFGNNIPHISNDEIQSIQKVEETSKKTPVTANIEIGQNALVSKGSLKGSIVKVCSLPSKDRVNIFLNFLGSKRKISISINALAL